MSIFSLVKKETEAGAPAGIIYGMPGVGKTTFAASAPNCLIIDCEGGADNVVCERTPTLHSWAEIHDWLTAVESGEHDYKVIAIDSVDMLLRRLEEDVTGAQEDAGRTLNKSHGGYGNGKSVYKNRVYTQLIPLLNRIKDRGIAVLLIAHMHQVEILDSEGIKINKIGPNLPEDFQETFVSWASFVCVAQIIGDERVLLTEGSEMLIAKNRFDMPELVPMTWKGFVGNMKFKKAAKKAKTTKKETE